MATANVGPNEIQICEWQKMALKNESQPHMGWFLPENCHVSWCKTIPSIWGHHFQVVVDLEDEQCRAENLCWDAMQWSKLKVPRATDVSSHFLDYNVPKKKFDSYTYVCHFCQ